MPTKALLKTAQYVMDAYYQSFAKEEDFFQLEDFAYWIGKAYDDDIDQVAQQIYLMSRQESGTGQIVFSSDFLKYKEYDVAKDGLNTSVKIDFSFASFTFDSQNSGVQLVEGVGCRGNCGEFIRTTFDEKWQLKYVSSSSMVWWYLLTDTIEFLTNSDCKPQKVRVLYIPSSEDENFSLPKSRELTIATNAYNLMRRAKDGVVIDMTNNFNRNSTVETETDKNQLKQP